jgi:hypothetical protein
MTPRYLFILELANSSRGGDAKPWVFCGAHERATRKIARLPKG